MVRESTPAGGRKKHDYFDDTDVSANMTGKIVRGSAFVFGSSIAKFVLNLGATAILARLLSPEAYGLIAMVFVVTNFLQLFRDMNLSLATIQKKEITHAQVSTIYWLNVGITCVISLLILASAPAIAWFYGDPRLTGIAALITLAVLIRGFASQHQALLRRKMRFGAVTYTDIGSMIVGYVVSITLAWLNYGYWALAWLHVSTAMGSLVLNWIATGWRPGRPVRGSGIRSMLAFGGNLTGYSIVRYSSRSLDNALIGWYWAASALGIYSKSRDLLGPVTNYLTSPIGAVAIPSLSRLVDDPDRYRRTFHRLFEKIVLACTPVTTLILCSSVPIVEIVLGPKWTGAAPIIAILSVTIVTEANAGCVNWLFISQGRGGQLFRYGIFEAIVRVAATLIGLHWGIVGIAAALAFSAACIQMPVHIWYGCRSGLVRQADVYRTMSPIVLTSVLALAAVLVLQSVVEFDSPLMVLFVNAFVVGAVHLGALVITSSGRELLRDVRRGLALLFPRRA